MKTMIAMLSVVALALPAGAYPAKTKAAAQPSSPLKQEVDVNRPGLSEARKRMFKELNEVIPSMQGMRKSKGRNLFDGTKAMTHGTTCGLLPGVMLSHLGLKGPLTAAGTEGLRICGKGIGRGVFQESTGSNLPKPGDIYWLRYPETPKIDSVAHVGVIYEIKGDIWITADAGQGSQMAQEAKLVMRQMKKVDGVHPFLSGPQNTPGDSAFFRRIGGWMDLDKLLEAETAKHAGQIRFVAKGNSATCQ